MLKGGFQKLGERFLEDLWLDGGVADQRRLDSRKEIAKAMGLDQTAGDHGSGIDQITRVASLNFGEDLGVEVVMVEVDLPVAGDKGAALLPAGKFRDEEVGTSEFDIDVERFL